VHRSSRAAANSREGADVTANSMSLWRGCRPSCEHGLRLNEAGGEVVEVQLELKGPGRSALLRLA